MSSWREVKFTKDKWEENNKWLSKKYFSSDNSVETNIKLIATELFFLKI